MPPGYNSTIVATVAFLAAVEVPFPVELTALAMVGLVLRWALARQSREHDQHDARLSALEEQSSHERHLKHAWRNEVTAMRATIAMMVPIAQRCSCGSMDPLVPVLERLALDTKEPS